ncbi:MAG: hypothetical protein Q4D16_11815 [Eubacteriales bacterium]|nr:hypothetical protein [Eubacteriales bacterium]
MTEERFEQIIENAADKLDKSMNRAWNHRPVRIVGKTLSLVTGGGLIAGAFTLSEKGNHTAAKVCFISGCIVIIAGIAELLIFKKK